MNKIGGVLDRELDELLEVLSFSRIDKGLCETLGGARLSNRGRRSPPSGRLSSGAYSVQHRPPRKSTRNQKQFPTVALRYIIGRVRARVNTPGVSWKCSLLSWLGPSDPGARRTSTETHHRWVLARVPTPALGPPS